MGRKILGIEYAPLNVPLQRRLQTVAAAFWICTFCFMGLGVISLFFYLLFYTDHYWIPIAYIVFYVLDRDTPKRGGRRVQWMREWRLWRWFAEFFPITLVKTAEIDPCRNYIFGIHPHGILCAGAFSCFVTEGTGFSQKFSGLISHLLTLDCNYKVPGFREFFMCGGSCSSSKESIEYILTNNKCGRACCLVVGGAAESLCAHPGKVNLILKPRKGFVRMALKTGTWLVPVFSFGETDLYEQIDNPEGSWIRWLQEKIRRRIGVAPALFKGRGIFQYTFGIVPFRKPVHVVVGEPIPVEKTLEPTKEQVDELHSTYMDALVALFEKYKGEYCEDPTMTLQIT
ncbi:unnamed protein product [Cyprideis torosa]|uniref:Acyltransferase n=1 Tax=Cyprideis torosa TaxID=163714 RepID=A0A7R8WJF6_9CRUS|nr:unnamed protein product [Cyprideis torosa]CAG0895671.1 unnamed protein product [Cyprideis torosa]